MRLRRAALHREAGQSLIELQMTTLVMLTLLFGIIETSRALYAYTVVANASRMATRYAIVHGSYSSAPSGPGCAPATAPNVASVGQAITVAAGLTGATVAVCYAGGNTTGEAVTVTASYLFTPIVPLAPIGSFTLSSTSEGRICY